MVTRGILDVPAILAFSGTTAFQHDLALLFLVVGVVKSRRIRSQFIQGNAMGLRMVTAMGKTCRKINRYLLPLGQAHTRADGV